MRGNQSPTRTWDGWWATDYYKAEVPTAAASLHVPILPARHGVNPVIPYKPVTHVPKVKSTQC